MKFKISYKLEFNNEVYERNFSEENSEHNVYELTGRNELGKTTTLEVVAYAFGATKFKTPTINDDLLNKIQKFDANNVKLSYDIFIDTGYKAVELKRDKDGDKEYLVDGEHVSSDEINNQFIVFFDVPEELYNKLKNAIKNVGKVLTDYTTNLNNYKRELVALYTKLSDFKQKNEKKDELKKDLDDIDKAKKEQNDLLKTYESEKDKKFIEYIIYKYNDLLNEFKKDENEIKDICKKIKEYNSNKIKVQSLKSGDELRDKIYDKKQYFSDYLSSEYVEKQEEFQNLIAQLKSLSNPALLSDEIISSYYKFFEDLKTKLDDDIYQYSKQSDIKTKRQELELIEKLIDIINEYSNVNIEIPGTNVKLSDILKPLYTRKGEIIEFLQKNGHIETKKMLSNSCDTFITLLGKVEPEFKEYKNSQKNSDLNNDELTTEDREDLEQKKLALEKELDRITLELTKYEEDYKNIPEEKKKILIPQDSIEDEYRKLKDIIDKINKKIIELDKEYKLKSELLKNYETIEEPKTSMNLDEINNKMKIIDQILKKIGNYINFINGFTKLDANSININNEDKAMADNIGRYLASILGYTYHNHKPYKIINIDFANKEYILDDNTHLSFNFIGRGTSALNSLRAKLEQPFNGKQKIILIDEIGDMDSDNKKILLDTLKQHSSDKDSILALLTERIDNDKIEIRSL